MTYIPISQLNDDTKIWSGIIVRLYNIGLNVSNKSKDYYEYLISEIYGNNEYLQLTCLSQGEAGNIICILKKDLPNHYALGKELKRMMDVENAFIDIGSIL